MEQQVIENLEIERPKTKSEILISKAHFAGNYEKTGPEADRSKDIFMVELDSIKEYVQFLPYLPDGFGFTGGVARNALLELLGDKPPEARDIDIEGIRELITNEDDVARVSAEYPPGKGRDGVTINKDLSTYFSSRDFTLNEVFLYGNHLYFSRQALEDTGSKIIRPTDYEKYTRGEPGEIHPKILLKALLLQSEFIKMYGHSKLENIEEWQWNYDHLPAFEVAMGINKACQKQVSLEFLGQLFDKKLLDLADLPDGATRESLRKLQGLVKHWMLNRDRDNREFEFGDAYFDQAYPDNWQKEDDAEFDKIYDEYHQKISHAVKIKSDVTSDDLDY